MADKNLAVAVHLQSVAGTPDLGRASTDRRAGPTTGAGEPDGSELDGFAPEQPHGALLEVVEP